MFSPTDQAAPMPPMPMEAGPQDMAQDAALGAPTAPTSPIEAVISAVLGLKAQRDDENAAVLAAVMAATGGMPSGLEGVSEGPQFGAPAPAGPAMPEMGGAY